MAWTTCSEIWRDIPGYEGRYQASNLGRIRSVDHEVVRVYKGRVLRPRLSPKGYQVVTISGSGPVFVHGLVAAAFLGKKPENSQVRHLNGDPSDARADNLAYGTQSENEHDKYRYGDQRGRKLSAQDVRSIRKRGANGEKAKDLAKEYGVTARMIECIIQGAYYKWLKDESC